MWTRLGYCEKHLGGQSSESAPMGVHTHALFVKAIPPPPIWDRDHMVWCAHCLVEPQLGCPANAQRIH